MRSELLFFESRCGAVPILCLQMQPSRDFVRVGSLWLERRAHFADGMSLALSLGHFLFRLVQPSAEFVRVGSLSL